MYDVGSSRYANSQVNKGNSSIPLFKTHKSMDKKQNRGNKLKLRETHKYKRRTTTQHYNVTNTHKNGPSIRQNPTRITNITSKPNTWIWDRQVPWHVLSQCEFTLKNKRKQTTQLYNVIHTETNYNITMAIFLTWYRAFLKEKMVGWTWFCGMPNLAL